jgi:ribosomal protein S6--L-glutamate ligase
MQVRRAQGVPSAILVEVFERLARRGFQIADGIAEERVARPDLLRPDHDLYVLKSHTELSLSLAGVLHAHGARILNPYPSCARTQNKIVVSSILRAAGIPAPRTWVTGDLTSLAEIAREVRLIVKPYRGHRGAGIHVIDRPQQLADIPARDTPLIAQEYVPGTGEDLKVYVVGDRVFGVRKPFSDTSFAYPGIPGSVDATTCDIARRCGEVLGLGLYGLDIIESPSGPVVVDVNYFPGYKGVPAIAPIIADYIAAYALGTIDLTPADFPPRPRAEQPHIHDRDQNIVQPA